MTDDEVPIAPEDRSDDDGLAPDGAAADAFEETGTAADGSGEGESAEADSRRDEAPLSDLARRVERRRAERDEAGDDSLFESMAVESMDSESVWAGLVEAESDTTSLGAAASVESVADELPGQDDYIVPKSEFCQQCPHFSDPPAFACTREGTELVEVVDSDRFRVRNCPMVEDE